jgi:hypothetical protein
MQRQKGSESGPSRGISNDWCASSDPANLDWDVFFVILKRKGIFVTKSHGVDHKEKCGLSDQPKANITFFSSLFFKDPSLLLLGIHQA